MSRDAVTGDKRPKKANDDIYKIKALRMSWAQSVKKFQDFSIIRILREFNFGECTGWGVHNFTFSVL